eukprot:UN06904
MPPFSDNNLSSPSTPIRGPWMFSDYPQHFIHNVLIKHKNCYQIIFNIMIIM